MLNQREDATNLLSKVRDTVRWARRKLAADSFVLGGHGAGGFLGRLVHRRPVWGETCTGWFLTDEANRLGPGAPYADAVHYLPVIDRAIQAHPYGTYAQRQAFRGNQISFPWRDGWSDGIIRLSSASLDGAEAIVLNGVSHSREYGRDWYGASKAVIRRWWPRNWPDGTDHD